MKNAMTRKFIAAVLAFAMLLGTVQVFANPNLPERNPATPVSLYIHHIVGTLSDPVGAPGEWLDPNLPQEVQDRPNAYGTFWRALRVVPPAGWNAPDYVQTGPPDTVAGTTTVPAAVLTHIRNTLADTAAWTVAVPIPDLVGGPGGTWTFGSVYQQRTVQQGQVNAGRAIFSFGTAHGLYLTWEVPNPVQDLENTVANPAGTVLTPDYGIIPPFLVNLPTFRHQPVPPDATPQPTPIPGHSPTPGVPNYPGEWIYRVHVFPKGPAPLTGGGKSITDIEIGSGTSPAYAEYTLTSWRITVPVGDDLATLSAVPNAAITARGTAAESGLASNTHILIQDVLHHRLRMLPATYVPTPAVPTPLPGPLTGPHTDAGTTTGFWMTMRFLPTGAASAIDMPRLDGTDVLWVVTSETRTGTALPSPHYVTPVPTPPGTPTPLTAHADGQQMFWVHVTYEGIQWIANQGTTFAGGHILLDFRTRAEIRESDIDPIENTFDLNYGNRPTVSIGDPPGDEPPPVLTVNNLDVLKTNPNNTPISGAVFFLFRCYQMTGAAGSANRVPVAGAVPFRIAISGGVAGSTLTSAGFVSSTGETSGTVFDAEWALVQAVPAASPAPPAGVARFTNLPMSVSTPERDNWYLFEAMAPEGGYRRIEGYSRVQVVPQCSVVHDCATAPADSCVFDTHQVNLTFTNTRDFVLPMTGGLGTFMFTAGGVSLMGIAGLFLFLARKKDKVKEVRTQ